MRKKRMKAGRRRVRMRMMRGMKDWIIIHCVIILSIIITLFTLILERMGWKEGMEESREKMRGGRTKMWTKRTRKR